MNGTKLIIREETLYLSSWIMLAQEQIGVKLLTDQIKQETSNLSIEGMRLCVFLQQNKNEKID